MKLRVLHVVESLDPAPGSVMVSLPGFLAELRTRGLDAKVTDAPSDPVDADVLHIHGWGYKAATIMARRAKLDRRPYVLSPYGAFFAGHFDRPSLWRRLSAAWRERPLIRRASAVTAVNDVEESELRKTRVHANVVPLPLGLTLSDYTPSPTARTHDARTLLVSGSLHPRGGCVILLKALADLGSVADGWTILFAAADEREWRPMLEAAVRRKGGDDRVRFLSAPDIPAQRVLFASASLVVAPNLHVDLPVSIMQAAACGVPVVATTSVAPSALNEAIRVCPPRREALREALRSMLTLTDPERRAMTQNALAVARSTLDWSALAGRYIDLYQTVANPS